VLSIDAKQRNGDQWEVFTHGGRQATGLDAIAWAVQGVEAGAGEILITSMDRDGTGNGFDLALTQAIAQAVHVPVIASGGAGLMTHFSELFEQTQADAALAATLFHDKILEIPVLKRFLLDKNIPIRQGA
jgi:cyclase